MPNLWLDSFNNLIICTKGQKWGSNYGGTGEKYDLFTGLLQDWKPFQKPNCKLSVLYRFGSFNEGLRNQIRCHGGQSKCILIPSNMSQNCAMKQLIHNTASYLPRLQSLEHRQAFIIPHPEWNRSGNWNLIWLRTVVLTSSFHRCVDCCRALSSYKSLHLIRHLRSFLVGQVQPFAFVTTKTLLTEWMLSCSMTTEHASSTYQNSV